MSDHVDGPRSIGEPAADLTDLTDLFAFTSPENSARTVLGACVFPSAKLAGYYNVAKPDYGANWQFRTQVQFLFPK